jgi:hypothetical protein
VAIFFWVFRFWDFGDAGGGRQDGLVAGVESGAAEKDGGDAADDF